MPELLDTSVATEFSMRFSHAGEIGQFSWRLTPFPQDLTLVKTLCYASAMLRMDWESLGLEATRRKGVVTVEERRDCCLGRQGKENFWASLRNVIDCGAIWWCTDSGRGEALCCLFVEISAEVRRLLCIFPFFSASFLIEPVFCLGNSSHCGYHMLAAVDPQVEWFRTEQKKIHSNECNMKRILPIF